jgi:aminoglycoside 6'-N-acetyltransferase
VETEYIFRPMTTTDLALIQDWLASPHVREWWGDPDEQYALVRGDLGEPAMDQYVVCLDDKPFGYLQCYSLAAWNTGFGLQPPGTRGVDLFIGTPDMIGLGHGSALLRLFVDDLLRNGSPQVVTDPSPANARAIRAYEKAGFERNRIVDTPDGPALLMIRSS